MQIRFLCSVLLLILSCAALAQSPYPILQTQKPEPGVYLTFKEFQNNSPSIKSDFALKPVSMARTLWAGIVDHELVFTGANAKLQARDCWGVSIGDSVYVNLGNFIAARGFRKFEGLGRYCYIQAYADLREPNQASLPAPLDWIGWDAAFILNINNGNFFKLDKFLMQKVLEKDDELLSAYENEKKKNDPDVIISYVKRYNERHKDEIGIREKTAQLTIYRREKKQQAKPVTIMSSDSTQFSLVPSDYKTFYLKKGMVTLCLGKHCETFSLSIDEVTYLECSYKEDQTRPQLLVRPKKEGEFYRRQIEFENEKKHASEQ